MPEPLPVRPARPDEIAAPIEDVEVPSPAGRHPSAGSNTADVGGYEPTLDRAPARRSVYEEAGGMPFFVALVDRFYRGVEADPALLAVYPAPGDLSSARHRLALFLAQYWGGPTTYNELRGQPRLFLRHRPFPIDAAARDRWLTHMRAAVAAMAPPPGIATRLLQYFDMAAEAMRNRE